MNANQIFAGEEYAWFKSKPKGSTPEGAAKVKVIATRKVKNSWAKNASTEVQIEVLAKGTGYSMQWVEVGTQKWVPARDILDFWDAYEDEMEAVRAARAERERQYELQRLERERKRQEEHVRNLVVQELVGRRLVERGLPYGSASKTGDAIFIKLDVFLAWLGITEDEISNATLAVLSADDEGADVDVVSVLNLRSDQVSHG